MPSPKFAPGFRLSALDIFVIIVTVIGSVAMLSVNVWWAFCLAFVVLHFFLFCNVFRLARPLELLWAAVFVMLAGATIVFDQPGWPVTAALSLVVTLIVVAVEMRKPSYHGIAWRQINPNLPQWWDNNSRTAHAVDVDAMN